MSKKATARPAAGPARRPLAAEDFLSLRYVEDVALAPGGAEVAYVLQEPNRDDNAYHRSIWIAAADGSRPPRRFTAGGKDGDFAPRWSPDGRRLAFLSCRAGKPQIFLIDRDGGEARQLTRHPQGTGPAVWSPDGRSLAFTARMRSDERGQEDAPPEKSDRPPLEPWERKLEDERRTEIEKHRFDPRLIDRLVFRMGTEFWDGRRNQLYVQGIDEEKARRISDGEFDHGPPAWTIDGRFLLACANRTGDEDISVRANIYRFPLAGGEPVALTTGPDGDVGPLPTPDGQWIVYRSFLARDLHCQRSILRRVSIAGGRPEDLTEAFDRDPELGPGMCRLDPDGQAVYFVAADRGDVPLFRVPVGGGAVERVVSGHRSVEAFDLAAGRIALTITAPAVPGDLHVTDLDGGEERRLTEVNAEFLAGIQLSTPEPIRFEGPGGLEITGWIMKPPDFKAGRRYPLAVEIHGGPHIMWGNTFWHEFQVLAGRGYIVFFCNPRGSDGYGTAFKGAIRRAWGDDDMGDILAGVDAVVARGDVDQERLAVTGGSFGGFMTAWLVAHDHRFQAAVAQRGVYNFHTQYGNSDALQLIEWDFGTLPWDEPDFLYRRSPIAHVRDIRTPLLILHSEQDYRAGIASADEFFVALRRLGKPVKMVRYPREGHELSRSGEPRHRIDRIERIVGWFDEHAGRGKK